MSSPPILRVVRWGAICAVLLFCVEVGLRVGLGLGNPPLAEFHPEVEYKLVPSRRYNRFGNRIDINRFGMRAEDHEPIAAPNERRILLLGDSVVYGNHLLDQDETIAYQMQALLSAQGGTTGCHYRVMPLAASSWGPVNQAAALRLTGLLDAEMVILVASGHDIADAPSFTGEMPPYRTSAPLGATGDLIRYLFDKFHAPPDDTPRPYAQRVADSEAALDEIGERVAAGGAGLHLAYHQTAEELSGNTDFAGTPFRTWADGRAVPFLILEQGPAALDGYRDAIHPNASGSRQIAETLARYALPKLSACGT